MTVDDYVLLQRRVGLTRAVFVQAKYHRTDNSCTLDAVRRLGANGGWRGRLDGQARFEERRARGDRAPLLNPAELDALELLKFLPLFFQLHEPVLHRLTDRQPQPQRRQIRVGGGSRDGRAEEHVAARRASARRD